MCFIYLGRMLKFLLFKLFNSVHYKLDFSMASTFLIILKIKTLN